MLALLIAAAVAQAQVAQPPERPGPPDMWIYCVAADGGAITVSPVTSLQLPQVTGEARAHALGRIATRRGGSDLEPDRCYSFRSRDEAAADRGASLSALRARGSVRASEAGWQADGRRVEPRR